MNPESPNTTPEDTSDTRRFSLLPQLDRDDRLALLERLKDGAGGGPDFILMMSLSTALASLGLLQGSTAVVIGAMLVAPLMGPLIAAGMALVQGNLDLFRHSVRVVLVGAAIGLSLALVVGALNPGYEPSLEIEARGNPDVFDLLIALFSGMVAAYAAARPNVSGTLAGVAIAAALLPPLAVVGITLTNGRPEIAINATVLFVTNLVAIIIGAAFIFRLLGVHAALSGAKTPQWAKDALQLLILATILMSPPLVMHAMDKQRLGQSRPLAYPVSVDVHNAVEGFLKKIPEVELISIGRLGVDPTAGVTVLVTTRNVLPVNFRVDLQTVVQRARKQDIAVRVFAFWQAAEDHLDPPAAPG